MAAYSAWGATSARLQHLGVQLLNSGCIHRSKLGIWFWGVGCDVLGAHCSVWGVKSLGLIVEASCTISAYQHGWESLADVAVTVGQTDL